MIRFINRDYELALLEREWHKKERKEKYGLVAKKIENKTELRKKGFLIYDLEDWK
jgi:hypothetical protein